MNIKRTSSLICLISGRDWLFGRAGRGGGTSCLVTLGVKWDTEGGGRLLAFTSDIDVTVEENIHPL